MTRANPLPRTSPESQGVPSEAVLEFVRAAERDFDSIHSFMLLRHGSVIAEGWWEPYRAELPHSMYSVSKSFTSTAVGLAIAEGLFTLEDRIVDLLPEDVPAEIGTHLAALRVRHLLTMTTGHARESIEQLDRAQNGNWARHILAEPFEFEPGTHFVYNSGASYLLSAIVQRASGERLIDYLQPRLFGPLGIADASWDTCPRGINTGGWGLNIRTEDLAAFGQLYLQKGSWGGTQLVPSEWVEQATSWQVPNGDPAEPSDWSQGYGFQFWQCRNGAYRGDGAFGQYCLVLPEQDAVLVMTGGLADMQIPLDRVWQHLLPALSGSEPLPPTDLETHLTSLRLPPQQGSATSPLASIVCGRTYELPDGGEISLQDHQIAPVLRWQLGDVKRKLYVPFGEWAEGATTPYDHSSSVVVASGAWTSGHTFAATLWFYESPFSNTVTLEFDETGDTVTIDIRQNVSFADTHLEHAVGRAITR
jgi:hypothetical protein